ncbi:unnamed protein product [Dibothriocephalus latus]|uniref:Uncharacterized protein n=1 Tax=Dibothriocephalus latus TaxID=60516 RepID=A0A3P7RIA7_DIBLA|nr:unnamed protein product [Dibothriocephalus latus]
MSSERYISSLFSPIRPELDHLDPTSGFAGFTSRYAESFHVSLHLMCSPKEQPRQGSTLVYPWETLPAESDRSPKLCFSSDAELQSCVGAAKLGAFPTPIHLYLSPRYLQWEVYSVGLVYMSPTPARSRYRNCR